jgi:Tol biopolymer transport system component
MKSLLLAALPLAALSTAAVAGPAPLTPRYEGHCQSPQWAPDGSKIAYEVNYHDRKTIELYLITASGDVEPVRPSQRGDSALTAGFSSTKEDSVTFELTWSPSALNSYIYSASGSLRDYNLHIKGGTPLAVAPGTDGNPRWSPTGGHVVFASARTGQGDLYLMDVRKIAEPPKRLTRSETSSELYPAWSPNGKMIAYVGHSQTGDNLFLIEDLANPQSRQLTEWQHMQTRPSFSPDGQFIAFYSNHENSDRFDLWITEVDGSPRKLRSDVVMNSLGPTWLPDSKSLLVVADEDAKFDPLYKVSLSGASKRLKTGTVGNGDHDLTTLADGNSYLALAAQGTEEGDKRDFRQLYVMQLP